MSRPATPFPRPPPATHTPALAAARPGSIAASAASPWESIVATISASSVYSRARLTSIAARSSAAAARSRAASYCRRASLQAIMAVNNGCSTPAAI